MVKRTHFKVEDEIVVPRCVIPNNDNTLRCARGMYEDFSYNAIKNIRIQKENKKVDENQK